MEIIHIRPYQILCVDDGFGEEVNFFMPQPQGQGSVTTLESIMLLKLLRIVNPDYVFEFGTYKGLTTRFLLANLPNKDNIKGERIYTLDLPSVENVQFIGSDLSIAKETINFKRKYLSHPKKYLVKQLLQDCLTLDANLYLKKFQFIFIDGNHSIKYAKCDTENSLQMLANPPSCLVWHDYKNPEFPELTAYIEAMARNIQVYHIEDTMIAFHLQGISVAPKVRTY